MKETCNHLVCLFVGGGWGRGVMGAGNQREGLTCKYKDGLYMYITIRLTYHYRPDLEAEVAGKALSLW